MVLCRACGRRGCECIPTQIWSRADVGAAVRRGDAAELIRLLLRHLPHLSHEDVSVLTGLSTRHVDRIATGAGLVDLDKIRRALTGLGADAVSRDLRGAVGRASAERVHDLVRRPQRVEATSANALAALLADQRRLDDVLGAAALIDVTHAQARVASTLADQARGAHAHQVRAIAAEWIQFEGWLLASTGAFDRAVPLLEEAERAAVELGEGTLVAQARNFLAYVARRRGDFPALTDLFTAAYRTPGAHPAQQAGDARQAAHGHALLGERDQARRLLQEAADLAERARGLPPPETAYWLTAEFSLLGLGLAHAGLEEYDVAADLLSQGLEGLPEDQRGADWTQEYRQALARARQA